MTYDITEKLNFDADPKLKINDVELTIKSDAENVLQILDILQNSGETEAAVKCMPILLEEEDQEKLRSLHLKMNDYIEVMEAAVSMALGEDPGEDKQGE